MKRPSYEELEQKIAFLENEASKRMRFEQVNRTLLNISNAINTSGNLEEFFRMLHVALSSVIDTTNFFIALYNPTNDSITFPYIVDAVDGSYPPVIEISKTESLTAEVIRTRNPLMISKGDVLFRRATSPLSIPACTPPEIWLGVPLLSKEKMLGVLAVQSYTDPQCYDHLDMDLMVSVAELVAVAIENVTAEESLKASEGRFRTIVDLAIDGIVLTSNEGLIIEVNKNMCKLFGYSREEVIGKSIADLHVWESPDDRWALIESLQRDGQVRNFEFRFRMKNGTKKIGLLSANIVTLSGVPHILAVTKDISHLKRIEKEKHELEVKYLHSQKMEAIGTMAGGIAHDFNNMLAVIIGNAEMALLDIPVENPGRHCVDQIILASQRVKELVKQILTFSRQSDQKMLPVKCFSVIEESLRLLRSTIPTTVNIIHSFSKDKDTIMADVTQLHQLLMNLCTNAVHAMDEKGTLEVAGVLVELAAEDLAGQPGLQPGQYIKLSVSDTGGGIAREIKDRIFDPFFTTKGVQEGTGMGLSIVLGIVESHGGFIRVDSDQAAGTTFALFFPLVEHEPTAYGEKVSRQYSPKSGRILFVDDEEMIANVGGSMLDHLGYQVTVETSSVAALENFRSAPEAFDLVITDQSMPNMSGAELSGELLTIRPDLPIILCTGHSKKLTTEDARRLGIREYLTKPFDMGQLEKLIAEILEGR